MTARALAAALVGVLLAGATAALPAVGFSLKVHDQILEQALGGGNTMSEEALKWVKGSFLLGTGNAGSDRDQLSSERHFDGVRNPAELCQQWQRLNAALDLAVSLSAPEGAEKRQLKDRKGALEAFGEATHALADFYSHSNWIELHQQTYKRDPLAIPQAPILGQKCDPAAFPKDLQSGYFSLRHGLEGCPGNSPPQGYRYCHSQIAKDSPDHGHGADEIHLDGTTYHQVAKWLSVKATRSAWEALHDRIVARYSADETIDAECLFMKLAWGGDRSCHRLWRVEGKITTHQEYALRDARVLHDLTLTTVQIRMQTEPVEYPGPRAAPVYADVPGGHRVAGTFCQRVISRAADFRRCDPFRNSHEPYFPRAARLKVSPKPDPIELNWRLQFPGKKNICQVVIRLDLKAGTTQPFPNCAGPMQTLTPRSLKFSGQFKVMLDRP